MDIDQLVTDLAPGVILIVTLCGSAVLLLTLAASRFRSDSGELVTAINALLPQTQCAQCGYPGCRPYATAIAEGEAVNRCPPGGEEVIAALAELLGREATALDSSVAETAPPMVARIREEICIGCTLCIAACPVDAIIGAPQLMHTVLEEVCTGCDLCRPPCPVDCIDLLPSVKGSAARLHVAELTGPAEQRPEQACINCGFCAPQCPRDLNPQSLYWYRQDIDRLLTYKLDDCIECGICDRVCPSELPLTRTFIASKKQHRQQQAAQQLARETEAKYLRRQQRLTLAAGRVRTRPSQQDRAALLVAIQKGATRLNTVKEGDPAP